MLEYSEKLELFAFLYHEVLKRIEHKHWLIDEIVLINDIGNKIMHIK